MAGPIWRFSPKARLALAALKAACAKPFLAVDQKSQPLQIYRLGHWRRAAWQNWGWQVVRAIPSVGVAADIAELGG